MISKKFSCKIDTSPAKPDQTWIGTESCPRISCTFPPTLPPWVMCGFPQHLHIFEHFALPHPSGALQNAIPNQGKLPCHFSSLNLPWKSPDVFFGGKSTFEVFKFLQCVNGKFWRNTWQQGKPLWNHILTRWQLFQNQVKTGGNTSWDCNLNCTFHKAKDLLFGAWLLQIQCQLNTVNQMIYDDT